MSDVTFELPHAPVARLMKKSLTDKNIQVAKGVKSATAKSSGLFILYVMNVAQSYASDAGRQTVMAEVNQKYICKIVNDEPHVFLFILL